jgi:hypothetical protein
MDTRTAGDQIVARLPWTSAIAQELPIDRASGTDGVRRLDDAPAPLRRVDVLEFTDSVSREGWRRDTR